MRQLIDLPPELLEQIFLHLQEPKDILSISETCKQFNQIVDNCDGIIRKLTLFIRYPSNITAFTSSIKNTKRRYRNFVITRSRERTSDGIMSQLVNAFSAIGNTVKFLKLNWHPHRSIEVSIIDINRLHRPRREVFPFLNLNHRNNNIQLQRLPPPAQPPPLNLERDEDDLDEDDIINFANNFDNGNVLDTEQNQNPLLQLPRDKIRDELHKEFIEIIKQFKKLEIMEWNNVHVEKKTSSEDLESLNFTHMKQLKLKYCDPYCFEMLSSCSDNLIDLEIREPFWGNSQPPGIETFENFLVQMKALKVLKISNIQYPRLFQNDSTANIQFKLNHLVLNNVFFKDRIIAESFFRTQTELISIEFQVKNEKLRNLDELSWYNNIIRIIFSQNPMLYSVNFEKLKYKIDNCDFISSTTNTNVQELKFNVTGEDKNAEFFKQLLRVFPNLRRIQYKSEENDDSDGDICFEKGTTLEKVKTLSIVNCSVRSLINVYAENLESFEYSPKLNGQFIDDYIGGFLHTHRGIKHLVIGSKTDRSYFFVSYILCELIVNFLNQLESITIYNFAEVNKSVKLLCTLRNLKSLTLSTSQYQQFTAKTKVECERMKLKLIPVEIGFMRESIEFSSSTTSLDYN